METTIWKYELKDNKTSLSLPYDAQILSVQVQHGEIMLWAKLNPRSSKVSRVFRVIGTGQTLEPNKNLFYIDTIQMGGCSYVFHVFEEV